MVSTGNRADEEDEDGEDEEVRILDKNTKLIGEEAEMVLQGRRRSGPDWLPGVDVNGVPETRQQEARPPDTHGPRKTLHGDLLRGAAEFAVGDLAVVVVVPGVDVRDVRADFGDQLVGDGLGEDVLILIASLDFDGVPFILLRVRIRGGRWIALAQRPAGCLWFSVQGHVGKKNGRESRSFSLILLQYGILGDVIDAGSKGSSFALPPQHAQLLDFRPGLLILHTVQKVLRVHPDPGVRALAIPGPHSRAAGIRIGLIHRTQRDRVDRDKGVVSDDIDTITTAKICAISVVNRLLDAIPKPQIMVPRQTGNELPAPRVHRTAGSPIIPMREEYLPETIVFLVPELIPIAPVALLRTDALARRPFPATVEEVAQEEERIWLERRLHQ